MNRRNVTFITDSRIFPTVFKNSKTFDFAAFSEDVSHRVFLLPQSAASSRTLKAANHSLYVKHLNGSGVYPLTQSFVHHLLDAFNAELPSFSSASSKSITTDLVDFTQRVMFPASTNALFGRTFPTHIRKQVFLFDEGFLYLYASLPSFVTKQYDDAIRESIAALSEMLDQGMQDANALAVGQDEAAKSEGCDLFTRGAIAFSLLWGLQTNATQAVFWCLAHLITYTTSDFQQRLIAEGREGLRLSRDANGNLTATPDIAKLTEAPLLSSLFEETLRHVSGTLMMREVSVDAMIEDVETGRVFKVKKGDFVALPARHLHRNKEVHDGPGEFRPERFVEKKAGRYELMPFGGGVSLCPGRFFASHEIKAFVAVALQLFDFKVVDPLPGLHLAQYGVGVMPPTAAMNVEIHLKDEWVV
ncbi:hypothetical protein HK097_002257 [Rhizophlyctis rosea]|uniref:Cytochrome P450 n=1 Tax=Rhizophlyctis rosea TaxID=64517 RepID=A0AAD5WYI1_9FUNG|nr:hypothetical protein HK097_002257 [Rhizophlyctis rosea]